MLTINEILNKLQSNTMSMATKATQESRLKTLGKLTSKHTDTCIYRIISNPQKYIPRLQQAFSSKTTQRNLVTTVLSILKHIDVTATNLNNVLETWKEFHQELAHNQTQNPSPTCTEIIQFDQVRKKYKELKKLPNPHAKLSDSLTLVFLAYVIYQDAKAFDLGNVTILKNAQSNTETQTSSYILLKSSSDSMLHIALPKSNQFAEETLHRKFYKALKKSLAAHPRSFLFVQVNKEPFIKSNSFNQFVLRNMKKLFDGKNIGINSFRYMQKD